MFHCLLRFKFKGIFCMLFFKEKNRHICLSCNNYRRLFKLDQRHNRSPSSLWTLSLSSLSLSSNPQLKQFMEDPKTTLIYFVIRHVPILKEIRTESSRSTNLNCWDFPLRHYFEFFKSLLFWVLKQASLTCIPLEIHVASQTMRG